MRLNIVTPERQLAALDVTSVTLPGMAGDLTVMGSHAPLVTTLRPGMMVVDAAEGQSRYLVTGGFAEISGDGASVLAEQATPEADLTREQVESVLEAAKALVDGAGSDEDRAAAALRVNDLTQVLGGLPN